MLKQLFIYISAAIVSIAGSAQCLNVPEEFVLETPKDYKDHEELAFQLMDCLVNNPASLDLEKTEESKAFCLIWLGGTPRYTVTVDTDVASFLDEEPEYLYHYIFSLAMIEHDFVELSQEEKESEALYLMALYDEKLSPRQSNKALKRIKKLHEKGKLVAELKKIKKECASSR